MPATISPMILEDKVPSTLRISIVLHESCLEQLSATLASLRDSLSSAQSEGHLGGAEVIVLDNASSEAYRSTLTALIERCVTEFAAQDLLLQLRLSDYNVGFGAGHNTALADARHDYILVLNPDVELAPDALSQGAQFLDRTMSAVALNPVAWRPDGTREYLCKRYPSVLTLLLRGAAPAFVREAFRRRLGRYQYEDEATPNPVELLSGACLLCRHTAFVRVGGFDRKYFMYFEDFDLSRRLARYGDLCLLPTMNIVHAGGFAARKGWRHIRWFKRSAYRFFRRHGWRLW